MSTAYERGHGTVAAYVAGCRCDDCTRASRLWLKAARLDALRGHPRTVDSTGTVRRVNALRRLGWTLGEIAAASGTSRRSLRDSLSRPKVRATTAERVRAAYDELWDATPPPLGRGNATRAYTRGHAARNGWALPMQWDDATIDDPTAQPWVDDSPRGAHVPGHGVVNADSLTDCASWGLTISEAADRLGVSRDAIEVGITRHAPELREMFARNLVAAEDAVHTPGRRVA